MSDNKLIAQRAERIFAQYMGGHTDIEVLSLATTDGFPVHSHTANGTKFDVDKMAAASSTLYSVSNAVSNQILSKAFKITFIESEQGNIAFVSLSENNKDFVLTMSANESMNAGQLRVYIARIANELLSDKS